MEQDLSDFITSDIVTDYEEQFALPDLLKCDYFKRHREGDYGAREATWESFSRPPRSNGP